MIDWHTHSQRFQNLWTNLASRGICIIKYSMCEYKGTSKRILIRHILSVHKRVRIICPKFIDNDTYATNKIYKSVLFTPQIWNFLPPSLWPENIEQSTIFRCFFVYDRRKKKEERISVRIWVLYEMTSQTFI